MFHSSIIALAQVVNHTLIGRRQMIVTAESCTGGLIAGALTDVPGSSDAVFGGYVTYANEAKAGMIGVDRELIRAHGAVSEQVARAMARPILVERLLRHFQRGERKGAQGGVLEVRDLALQHGNLNAQVARLFARAIYQL